MDVIEPELKTGCVLGFPPESAGVCGMYRCKNNFYVVVVVLNDNFKIHIWKTQPCATPRGIARARDFLIHFPSLLIALRLQVK